MTLALAYSDSACFQQPSHPLQSCRGLEMSGLNDNYALHVRSRYVGPARSEREAREFILPLLAGQPVCRDC